MDWSHFDEYFAKLQDALRERIGDGKNAEILDIYGSCIEFDSEIKIIVRRIETETQKEKEIWKRVLEIAQREEEPDKELLDRFLENFLSLRLDIKSFFIFTRIFLDTLARIIRFYYGKKGHQQLPVGMLDLVKSEKLREWDYDFSKELKDKLSWAETFVKHRVDFEHYLGQIHSTSTRNGKFGFDILSLRSRQPWGTNTIASITDYTNETLRNLSEVILCICSKSLS